MKTIWEIVENTAEGTANLMILVVTAQMFGWLISYYQITQAVTNFMLAFVSNKYMFWAIIIILLTICGVACPIARRNTNTSPNCTGSMPNAAAIGARIGPRIRFVVVEILCGILFALVPGISLLLPSIIG